MNINKTQASQTLAIVLRLLFPEHNCLSTMSSPDGWERLFDERRKLIGRTLFRFITLDQNVESISLPWSSAYARNKKWRGANISRRTLLRGSRNWQNWRKNCPLVSLSSDPLVGPERTATEIRYQAAGWGIDSHGSFVRYRFTLARKLSGATKSWWTQSYDAGRVDTLFIGVGGRRQVNDPGEC